MIKKILLFFNIIEQNSILSDVERVKLAFLNARDRAKEREEKLKPERYKTLKKFYNETVDDLVDYYNRGGMDPRYEVIIPDTLNPADVIALFKENGFDPIIKPFYKKSIVFDFSKPRLADNRMVRNPL